MDAGDDELPASMTQDGARRSRSPARRAPKFSSAVSKTQCQQDGQVRRSRSVNGVPAGGQRHHVLEPEYARGFGRWWTRKQTQDQQ